MVRQPTGLRINHAPARWPLLLLVSKGLSPWSLHVSGSRKIGMLSLQLGCWVGRSWQGPGDPTSPVWTWVCWEPCPNASSRPNPDPQQLPTHKPKNSLGSWDPENRQQSDTAPRSPRKEGVSKREPRELGLPCQALPRLDVRGSQAPPPQGSGGSRVFDKFGVQRSLPSRIQELHLKGLEFEGLPQPAGFAWVFSVPEKGQSSLFATDR